jgi:hypothetical protein
MMGQHGSNIEFNKHWESRLPDTVIRPKETDSHALKFKYIQAKYASLKEQQQAASSASSSSASSSSSSSLPPSQGSSSQVPSLQVFSGAAPAPPGVTTTSRYRRSTGGSTSMEGILEMKTGASWVPFFMMIKKGKLLYYDPENK